MSGAFKSSWAMKIRRGSGSLGNSTASTSACTENTCLPTIWPGRSWRIWCRGYPVPPWTSSLPKGWAFGRGPLEGTMPKAWLQISRMRDEGRGAPRRRGWRSCLSLPQHSRRVPRGHCHNNKGGNRTDDWCQATRAIAGPQHQPGYGPKTGGTNTISHQYRVGGGR